MEATAALTRPHATDVLGGHLASLRTAGLEVHPVNEGDSVLDVGCGTGKLLEAYVDIGATCSGIDLSEAMLAEAKKHLGDRADLRIGDATAMPYSDDSFDLAICALMIHELDPDAQIAVLREMARVMAPEGRALIIDYRAGPLRSRGRMLRGFSTVAEPMAGSTHYENWRRYLRKGGLPDLLTDTPLNVETETVSARGNLGLWLLTRF